MPPANNPEHASSLTALSFHKNTLRPTPASPITHEFGAELKKATNINDRKNQLLMLSASTWSLLPPMLLSNASCKGNDSYTDQLLISIVQTDSTTTTRNNWTRFTPTWHYSYFISLISNIFKHTRNLNANRLSFWQTKEHSTHANQHINAIMNSMHNRASIYTIISSPLLFFSQRLTIIDNSFSEPIVTNPTKKSWHSSSRPLHYIIWHWRPWLTLLHQPQWKCSACRSKFTCWKG